MEQAVQQRPHILIVDDNPDELRLLVELLKSALFRITIAFDGAQGYKRAVAVAPDLILMDIRMPITDGFTACRLLGTDPATKSVPIIFLTASRSLDDRLLALKDNGVDFILKPFEPAEVLARIKIHLKRNATHVGAPVLPRVRLSADQIIVNTAMSYLTQCLADPPDLKALARKVGTYEKKLSYAFRMQTGRTVFEFVRDERLRIARHLLLETNLSVTDIAAEVGFSSAANFATAFRKQLHVTPSEYRERPPATGDLHAVASTLAMSAADTP